MLLRTLLALTLVAAAGCAVRPDAVRRMDATRIQTISDYRLCDAAAVNLDERGQRYPVIENEIARRGVLCDEHITAVVSDCSMLRVVSVDTESSPEGAIFTIRNMDDQSRSFRIYRQGVQSSMFTVEAGATQQFGVAVDPNIAAIGETIATAEGGGDVQLNECRAVRDSYRFNYRPEARNSPGAANGAARSTDRGVRSRAMRNANMRAGPGTGHPIVGLLRAGEQVTVVGVADGWCECTRSGRPRAYVSCRLLSPPPGGWASFSRNAGA
jgi:Bacterial SH3 domain